MKNNFTFGFLILLSCFACQPKYMESSLEETNEITLNEHDQQAALVSAMSAMKALEENDQDDTLLIKEINSDDFSNATFSDSDENYPPTYSLRKYNFSKLNILELLLDGTFDVETGYQKWKAPKGTLIPIDGDGYAYTMVDTLLSFNQENKEYQLAVIKSSQRYEWGGFDNGFESAPCIGLALFSEENDNWVLESFNPTVVMLGEQNMIPSMQIKQVGTHSSAIIFTTAIHQDFGEEQWFLLEKNFPMFLEYTYAQLTGEDLEKLLFKKVEIVAPKEKDNAYENNHFYDLKVITYEEEYDEKTDKTKEIIKSNEVYTSVYIDFLFKYSFELK
jgi:hypothetical protein